MLGLMVAATMALVVADDEPVIVNVRNKSDRMIIETMQASGENLDDFMIISDAFNVYYLLKLSDFLSTSTSKAVWIKADHSRDKTTVYRTSLTRWRVDCQGETVTLENTATYKADGTLVQSSDIPSYRREVQAVVPGSIGETVMKSVCK